MIEELSRKLAVKHLGGPLESIKPIIGNGEVNKVYVIKSDTSAAVLRINDLEEFERFQKECWCIEQSMSIGIPGAKVYDTGTYNDYAYMLLEYIDGTNGKVIAVSPKLWEELGKYLRLIHGISVNGFGENLDNIIGGGIDRWKEHLEYNIDSLNDDDKLIKIGVFDNQTSARLKSMFQGLVTKSYRFGLNHGDYSLANVIVDQKSVAHIIDWGSAQSHIVPHHDLGVILSESLSEDSEEFQALLSGYGMSRNDFNSIESEVADLQLLEAIDKLRWALDKAPEWVEPHKKSLTKLLETT